MADFPELRTIANNGRFTTMLLKNCERPNSSEGVFVLGSPVSRKEADRPWDAVAGVSMASRISEVSKTSDGAAPQRRQPFEAGVNSVSRRNAPWTLFEADDRKVFSVWALWVAAFYAALALALLVAVLLGAYGPARKNASAAPAAEFVDQCRRSFV